jgi:hypothetical protein
MGIIEKLLNQSKNLSEKYRGTYEVIEIHRQPSPRRTQVGGDYRLVVALHIKGLGRKSAGNGSLRGQQQLTHGWRSDKVLCGKKLRGDIVEDRYNEELTCPGCINKAKKQSLQRPSIVLISE